jgi:hypothetical protein
MPRQVNNDGIWIEGSATVVAGAMAGGSGATAVGGVQHSQFPADLDELRAALTTLIMQLRSAPAGVNAPESLADIAVSAQREAQRSKPDKRILGGLLQALMAGVADSTALANAVTAIQHAVAVLL